jgi:hypothetical protein
MNNNYLSPRLVALAKDSALALYLDKWQHQDAMFTYKDIISMFSENDLDLFEKSSISIKQEFRHFNLPDLEKMISLTYVSMENVIKDTLRFLGNVNSGSGVEKFEWGHSHPH